MKKFYVFPTIGVLIFAIALITSCNGQSNSNSASKLAQSIDPALSDKIKTLVNRYSEYGEFNGAVLVAKEGEIIYQEGLGLANMEWDLPNKVNTKFRIGSITKQFTAMLIVQLAAEKRVDLHTPITTYLPEYPKGNGDIITLHHLLTHTSGIPNSYESTKQKPIKPDNYTAEELVSEFSALPLEFTPGDRFKYSNAGYTLLGLIIEQITNERYEEVLKNRILIPLNMVNTGFDKHRALINNRASGYFKSWGDYYNANYIDMSAVFAAGALYSTVEDLYLWDQALYTEQLVSKEYMDLIFTHHIPDPDYGGDYGYGWSLKDKPLGNSNELVSTTVHDGVIDGFCAIFTRIPSSKTSIILCSNIRRAPLNAMTKGIMGVLYNQPYDFPKKSLANSLLDIIEKEGIAKGKEFYESKKEDNDFYIAEDEMNMVSYKLLQSDRAKDAAVVLRMGIETFPNAFNLYDSYAEVLRALGNKAASIENYKKSVELNPNNENGKRMLKELGVK